VAKNELVTLSVCFVLSQPVSSALTMWLSAAHAPEIE
jgi:hypothetical protein